MTRAGTTETWRVVLDDGTVREVVTWSEHDYEWTCGLGLRMSASPRAAVVYAAEQTGMLVREILSPGEASAEERVEAERTRFIEHLRLGVGASDPPKAAKTHDELDAALALVKGLGKRVGVAVYNPGDDAFVRLATQAEDDAFVVMYQTGIAACAPQRQTAFLRGAEAMREAFARPHVADAMEWERKAKMASDEGRREAAEYALQCAAKARQRASDARDVMLPVVPS